MRCHMVGDRNSIDQKAWKGSCQVLKLEILPASRYGTVVASTPQAEYLEYGQHVVSMEYNFNKQVGDIDIGKSVHHR